MWHDNVDLLAYHDLDGQSWFKLSFQEVRGRFYLHVAGFWHSGWSIFDVTDPERPTLVRFVDGPPNTWTTQVQVADLITTGLLGTRLFGKLSTRPPAAAQEWSEEDSKSGR